MSDINSVIDVIVLNREETLFRDKANAVTSYNEKGIFDILPQHENFISLIRQSLIIHKNNTPDLEIKIENGLIKVYKDSVSCYVNFPSNPTQPEIKA